MGLEQRTGKVGGLAAIALLAAVACGPAACASTVGALAAVDAYRNTTQQQLAECVDTFRRSYRRMWLTRSTPDYLGCIRRAQAEAAAKLTAAARTVRKADAQRALVAYHAAFLAAIAGIAPYSDEPADGYEQRQSVLLHAMSHAWSRYEMLE
jgi:hypothetical protein